MHKTVKEAKQAVDSEELEGWKAFFKSYKAGGSRTSHDELLDVLFARLTAVLINLNSKTKSDVERWLLFKHEPTEAEMQVKRDTAMAKLMGYLAAVKATKRKK